LQSLGLVGNALLAAPIGRPRSSHGTTLWGQRVRAGIDRYAEGQSFWVHVAQADQGHERRRCEGTAKISGATPEGAETQEGIEGCGG